MTGKRLLAVGFAGALAAGTLASGTSSAQAAPVQSKKVAYSCKAVDPIVDGLIGGPQKFLVQGKSSLPKTVKAGSTLSARQVQVNLTLPPKLVKKVRKDLGVKQVAGTAKASLDINGKGVAIKGLKSPFVKVPKKGALTIKAKGKSASYKVPKSAKKLSVKLPKKFQLNAKLKPPPAGVSSTKINCTVAKGASRSITSIKVTK